MKRRQLGLCVICFFLSVMTLYAQKYQLDGVVQTEKNIPLERAFVLLSAHDTVVSAVMTNEKGKFRLENVPEGDFQFQVSLLGYNPVEQSIHVSKDIRLKPVLLSENATALAEIVVSADKRDLVTTKAGVSTFHISDKLLETSQNAYEALREIPKLVVDATNHKIKLNDGSSPLILINGVKRPGYIESLDPRDIESVEVIDNPSARFQREESVSSVINLKVKRKKQLANTFNIYTKQNPELIFGASGASFESANSKASFFINAQQWYFNKDDRSGISNLYNGSIKRDLMGASQYNANSIFLNVGGDWIISNRDYVSFGIEYITNPSKIDNAEQGSIRKISDEESSLQVQQRLKDDYYSNVYSLFFKHTFTQEQHLEATAKFGLFGSGSNGWRSEDCDWYTSKNLIDMDNRKQSFDLEMNYDLSLPDKAVFNVGANTYLHKTTLNDKANPTPEFLYKGANEYIYADVKGLTNSKFSYMLSLGVDLVFTNADGIANQYVNFVPSASLAYGFNSSNTLQFSFSRKSISPSISYLNPQNTSTDSLIVYVGNPYLKPALDNKLRLSYTYNRKGIYLEPFAEYHFYRKQIQSLGSVKDEIYTHTYENGDKSNLFRTGLIGRINIGSLGNISVTAFYQKKEIQGMPFNGNSWGGNMNLYLAYKKVSLNGFVYYTGTSYSRTSKSISAPVSEVTLTWNLPKGWNVNLGIRDIGKGIYESWGQSENFSSYSRTDDKDRCWMALIGFSYYFRNKVNQAYRDKKRMYNSDEGLGGIKLK